MQRLNPFDQLSRKWNRRFEYHPAQSVRSGQRPAVEAKPCVRIGKGAMTVDEVRNPDRAVPQVYSYYVVLAKSQDLALDSADLSPIKLAFHR